MAEMISRRGKLSGWGKARPGHVGFVRTESKRRPVPLGRGRGQERREQYPPRPQLLVNDNGDDVRGFT